VEREGWRGVKIASHCLFLFFPLYALCTTGTDIRATEIAAGDTLFSPFVAAGWSGKQEENVRPAQWLGLLKIHAAWGAEFFYAGFFSVTSSIDSHHKFQDSRGWCWQGMMPSYVQALMTQWAPFLYEGELVMADEDTTFAAENTGRWCDQPPYYIKCAKVGDSPLLWTGKPNVLAIARRLRVKKATQEQGAGYMYLITLAVQRLSNGKLNAHPSVKVKLQIPGLSLNLKSGSGSGDGDGDGGSAAPGLGLEARLQGSVYVWRNDTRNGSVVYQLDGWHEASHPLYWPQGMADARMEMEAEMFDGHLGQDGLATKCLVTELHPSAKHNGDFVHSTTFVSPSMSDTCSLSRLSSHVRPCSPRSICSMPARKVCATHCQNCHHVVIVQ
jgi:hypothetical protein